MDKMYSILILLIAITIIVFALIYQSQSIKREFKAEVLKGLKRTSTLPNEIITESDIKDLPEIVQKYLSYVGVIGKEKVWNVKTVSDIEMNMEPGKEPPIMRTEEYDFFDASPSRLAFMKFQVSGLPVFGLDSYINGTGSMLMKPLGLFTLANAKGKDMDNTSAAVLLLSAMCIGAPAALIDKRIKWTVMDPLTVRATFDDNRCSISAVLSFNSVGELTNFSSEDKYYSPTGKTYEKVKWSTTVRDYKNINGLRLSTYGEAVWHFPDGDFCYGKLTLKKIENNCSNFKS